MQVILNMFVQKKHLSEQVSGFLGTTLAPVSGTKLLTVYYKAKCLSDP